MLIKERFAAERLGMGVDFLRHDRIGRQIVPFVKIGSAIRYDTNALDQFIASNTRGGL